MVCFLPHSLIGFAHNDSIHFLIFNGQGTGGNHGENRIIRSIWS